MTISPWPAQQADTVAQLAEQVNALVAHNQYLQEVVEDAGLTNGTGVAESRGFEMEERGWIRMAANIENELFTAGGRFRVVETCRMMAVSHPLLKRGLNVRIGYIWGQGVEVNARVNGADGKTDPDLQAAVNKVIDDFEELNETSLTGMKACDELERALGTDGEVFLALFTDPKAGQVRVRSVPQLEMQRIVTNPEDRDEPWFYLREYNINQLPRTGEAIDATNTEVKRVLYPALGFDPKAAGFGLGVRPLAISDIPVMWDAPMVHLPVNRLHGWDRGIPDVYASIAWARFYQEFLVDWAGLTKALSKLAWKATGDTKQRAATAAAAAARLAQSSSVPPLNGTTGPGIGGAGSSGPGGVTVMGPGTDLTAVSKNGATIDSESGKPLAAMVAAGLGLPVTLLLADPGVTGARATAETLDLPTALEMGMRRLLWQSLRERIYEYAVTVAANAPGGQALQGVDPTLDFAWPKLDGVDPVQLVTSIVSADTTNTLPPLTVARLLLSALGVPDVDEVLAEITDDQGNFIPPQQTMQAAAGQAAVDAARRGQDATESWA